MIYHQLRKCISKRKIIDVSMFSFFLLKGQAAVMFTLKFAFYFTLTLFLCFKEVLISNLQILNSEHVSVICNSKHKFHLLFDCQN